MSAPHDESVDTHRRGLRIEVGVMLAVSFGVSAAVAVLQLIDAVLSGLSGHRVRLNENLSRYDLINLGLNLATIAQLVAWGALALYLLWRSGFSPARIGLGRLRWRADVLGGLGLAALIGIPGLLLYLAARWLGMNAERGTFCAAQQLVADPGVGHRGVRQRVRRRGRRGRLPDHPVASAGLESEPGDPRLQRAARALSPLSEDSARGWATW